MKTLTLSGVALALGVTRQTLYNMLRDGRFSVQPINGLKPRRWLASDVLDWLASNK